MPVIDILEIAKQGLNTNREALQTTSNNIANVNTPGYSRQKAIIQTAEQSPQGQLRMHGVELKQVVRIHDGFVRNQILEESKNFGATSAKAEGLRRMESLVHNDGYRIADLVNGFFNDFRELSVNPEMNTLLTNISSSAESASSGFKGMYEAMNGLRHDLDQQIDVQVVEVNTLAKEIAGLNGSIAQFRARGEAPLELLDRRDLALKAMADKIGFQLSKDEHDNANITAGGIGNLVNGQNVSELVVMRTPAREGKPAGSVDIFIKEGEGLRRVTNHMDKGSIGGMLNVRDKVVDPSMRHLDAAAYQFVKTVNEVHKQGVGRDGIGNRELFADISQVEGAAAMVGLSKDVKGNSEAIAVGMTPGAKGDNRIALRIADIQNMALVSDDPGKLNSDEKIAVDSNVTPKSIDGRQTLNETLNGLVGSIAVQTEHEDQIMRHQEAILSQLQNYEKSVSGVNLDEEAISLVQYQTAFNASAKAMKVGDELLQTILSLR
jgi:flagellar hook-associated protein 1